MEEDNRNVIKTLYERGVSLQDIFAVYYELEEAANGRTITVEDADKMGVTRNG